MLIKYSEQVFEQKQMFSIVEKNRTSSDRALHLTFLVGNIYNSHTIYIITTRVVTLANRLEPDEVPNSWEEGYGNLDFKDYWHIPSMMPSQWAKPLAYLKFC